MPVTIGTVPTFAGARADKAQAVKLLEEAAEVFSSWESLTNYSGTPEIRNHLKKRVIDECCDLIQATCNLLVGLGVDDLTEPMQECVKRNQDRGREYEWHSVHDSCIYYDCKTGDCNSDENWITCPTMIDPVRVLCLTASD